MIFPGQILPMSWQFITFLVTYSQSHEIRRCFIGLSWSVEPVVNIISLRPWTDVNFFIQTISFGNPKISLPSAMIKPRPPIWQKLEMHPARKEPLFWRMSHDYNKQLMTEPGNSVVSLWHANVLSVSGESPERRKCRKCPIRGSFIKAVVTVQKHDTRTVIGDWEQMPWQRNG